MEMQYVVFYDKSSTSPFEHAPFTIEHVFDITRVERLSWVLGIFIPYFFHHVKYQVLVRSDPLADPLADTNRNGVLEPSTRFAMGDTLASSLILVGVESFHPVDIFAIHVVLTDVYTNIMFDPLGKHALPDLERTLYLHFWLARCFKCAEREGCMCDTVKIFVQCWLSVGTCLVTTVSIR